MRSLLFPLVALSLGVGLFAACGGVVESNGSPAPTGTVPTTTATPTVTATTSPPSRVCRQTTDYLSIEVHGGGHDGACYAADAGPAGQHFLGALVKTDVASLTIDLCSPAADCVPMPVVITIKAKELDLRALPIGSYVQVDAAFTDMGFGGCTSSVVVQSVAAWAGDKNPVDVGGRLYVAAADGGLSATKTTAPLTLTTPATGCHPVSGGCGPSSKGDWFDLHVEGQGEGARAATLVMGDSALVHTAGHDVEVKNLRSYYDAACDDSGNLGWWAVLRATR